ncbi:threonine/homoserine/homoserine lactone efflux protein [Microvirga lupini]|uniref:Threonine/homoserine/homoserine lactone efflux protein n=1 Tax=Microvirga lupini TaxID=420324 RepID=A0A7W4VL16_9HYPH|nr:LysE family transporter [Microvirga lupini]MBB3018542.1 threonine/homoserine/homoserine lactone efflux protein [Microvirga lupini]
MIDVLTFVPAVAAILATPGPTNTLLASSGAQAGFRRSLPLVPAELLGYVLAIAGWGLFLEPASAALPWLTPALRLACAAYLVAVAWGLWSKADEALSGSGFGRRRVFTATLINPKAPLFAAVIFPEAAFQTPTVFLQTISIFAAVIVPIALAWIGFGSTLSRPGFFIRLKVIQRGAALVLLTFSASLGAAALG